MSLHESNGTFVRRDVWDLLPDPAQPNYPWDPITEAYAKAVAVMQARPAEDPTSWAYQGAIHGTYTACKDWPPCSRWNECQHGNWYFIPWHRMYLYYFERIVRAAVVEAGGPADFALPYWNYELPSPKNTLPLPFRQPTLPDGSPNPLYLLPPRRSDPIATGWGLPSEATSSSAAMAFTNFVAPPSAAAASFGGGRETAHFGISTGSLEQTPHNVIHGLIGGSAFNDPCLGAMMSDPNCAALDPIFWLHHANIDRLWNRWLALGGGRANPSEALWLNQCFVLYDKTGTEVRLTCAEVVDSAAQLGYVYDDDEPQPAAVSVSTTPARAPEPSGPPEMAAATEQPIDLTGGAVSVGLTVPPSTQSLVASDDVATGARATYLNVEEIEAARNPGIVYGVYVGEHHVGNIALFGIEKMNDPGRAHGGPPGFRHTFDITGVVAALREAGAWDPNDIRVRFEPLTLIPPPGQEGRMAAFSAEQAEAGAAIPVRIGRVSLFVA